ncbi:class I SAM-dependent methyltransferase [Patescibacteria group bacterium]
MRKNELSSFRDPSGSIYYKKSKVFRRINPSYFQQYRKLIDSGLYNKLESEGLIIKHKEIEKSKKFITIQPAKIPYISYPYEWSFSQIKDAALMTLKIQSIALEHGMLLKDASVYNIQFIGSKAIFIDTLSFEFYKEGSSWVAYRQFCQHFLAPMALMSYKDIHLNFLYKNYVDGIPLSFASRLLPKKTYLNFSMLSNIHLHARSQKQMADKKVNYAKYNMTKHRMTSLVKSLEGAIRALKIKNIRTEWEKYYSFTNYSTKAFKDKHATVEKLVRKTKAKTILDMGANTGEFLKSLGSSTTYGVACDIDPLAIESGYIKAKNDKSNNLLHLVLDITNPSPSIGWANKERLSFAERYSVDCVMALALVHHLAISNNLRFDMIASFFSELGKYLIIEFVPKEDSKTKILLQNREDVFDHYNQGGFEEVFKKYFNIVSKKKIVETKRTIYLMEKIK